MTGRLLVATPALLDPNFERTVVLLIAHGDEGALGVVLNRPLAAERVASHLPRWSEHVAAPAVVFSGGPVEPGSAIGLANVSEPAAPAWQEVIPGVALFDLELPEPATGLQRVRIFSGYAGWGAGQLESEIQREAWFVIDAQRDDVFSEQPDRLWREVLRRQPGKLSMFAYFPREPGVN